MTIVLAGGSGFLGRALHAHFSASGHTVRTLTRRPRPGVLSEIAWQPDGSIGQWAHILDDADVVVNLAGEGIADRRWNEARKKALRTSRILPARSLAAALAAAPVRPRILITNCAVGYYGARGNEPIAETTPPGDDFLAALCVDWEREAAAAASPTTRAAIVRTGIVLHPDGGALKSMLTPFRLGIGGPMGTGQQYMSWIHLEDWVSLVGWLAASQVNLGDSLENGATGGHAQPNTVNAVVNKASARTHAASAASNFDLARSNTSVWNATAPTPVTNAEFGRTLGAVLGRPAVLPAPAFGLKLLLGEFANFLLTGARVIPAAAERAGFRFRYRELEPALRSLLQDQGVR
jgi:uncharacterized protein (TIGR01777 family)